jgi:putative hemolysin
MVKQPKREIKAIIKEGTEGGEVQIEQDIVELVFILEIKINSLMTHRKSVVLYPKFGKDE